MNCNGIEKRDLNTTRTKPFPNENDIETSRVHKNPISNIVTVVECVALAGFCLRATKYL